MSASVNLIVCIRGCRSEFKGRPVQAMVTEIRQ